MVQAIAMAGGLGQFAARKRIQIRRKINGVESTFVFDYAAFEAGRDLSRQHRSATGRRDHRAGEGLSGVTHGVGWGGGVVSIRGMLFLAGICVGAAASSAFAADWSARTEFRQSAEISDNRALLSPPSGETYGSISQLIFNAVARYPALTFGFDADISYRTLTGPGADDNSSPMDNGVRARIEKLDRLTRYFLIGSWRRQDATSAQMEDTGLTFVKGAINTYALEAGLERQVAPLDKVLWSVRGVAADFDSPTASSYTDVTTTGLWTHRLNPLTDAFHLAAIRGDQS